MIVVVAITDRINPSHSYNGEYLSVGSNFYYEYPRRYNNRYQIAASHDTHPDDMEGIFGIPFCGMQNHVDTKNALKRETALRNSKTELEENNFPNSNQKIEDSIKSGASGDSVYKPKLAWFSAAEYLQSGNITQTAKENVDFEIVGTNDFHEENVDDDLLSVTHSLCSITSSNNSKKRKGYDDDFKIWGITTAMKTLEKLYRKIQ
ncbi:hypothetical protein PGB90_003034 [Kerria lacca]